MNLNVARLNMIQQQLKPMGVLDPKILDLMMSIPRERFVLPEFKHLAFCDTFVPIGGEQLTLPPGMIGRLLQALEIKSSDTLLEIGTGTGYITALLAHLCQTVISVEIIPELSDRARENINFLNLKNVTLEMGNAACGWSIAKPYDKIIFTGSLPCLPSNLINQLRSEGKIFAVLGETPLMEAVIITYNNLSNPQTRTLFETEVPPLKNAMTIERFKF